MYDPNFIRRIILRPYRKDCGPVFSLTMWDSGRSDWRGCSYIRYRLTMGGRALFEGDDFAGSPMHAIDADETAASLLGFLTLRPGDTDAEYFQDYTPAQRDYCKQHAETLAGEVYSRFGDH